MAPGATGAAFGADAAALERLRAQARGDPQAALKGAAQQFEALLAGLLVKTMRDSTQQDTPFDSSATRFYQSMLDQQLAQLIASRGMGLAEVMTRQLGPAAAPAAPAAPPAQGEFSERLWPHARAASRATGIPAQFIVAQAALESGWGRAEIRRADGSPSHNVFGIKAGAGWTGEVVEAATTEHVNGEPRGMVERFRAYGSYAEAFEDYARLLSQPRYAGVLAHGGDAAGFAQGLQQAGYATDPMYADKLVRVIERGFSFAAARR